MDTVGNLLTKIRNAYLASNQQVVTPVSHFELAILKLLETEGYLTRIEVAEVSNRQVATITLNYVNRQPVISRLRRLSKPGRRLYATATKLPRPVNGVGTIVISTPQGLMTGLQAKKLGLGGEVICEVIRGI